jgi:hypothetical protein
LDVSSSFQLSDQEIERPNVSLTRVSEREACPDAGLGPLREVPSVKTRMSAAVNDLVIGMLILFKPD